MVGAAVLDSGLARGVVEGREDPPEEETAARRND
jgi:hypothetical protein